MIIVDCPHEQERRLWYKILRNVQIGLGLMVSRVRFSWHAERLAKIANRQLCYRYLGKLSII